LIEYVSILERHVVIEVGEMPLTDMRRLNAEGLNLGANCRGNATRPEGNLENELAI